MDTTNHVISLYKSRQNLLKLLEAQGYLVDDHRDFSIRDVSIMNTHEQLDMLLQHGSGAQKVYVKYYLGKTLRTNVLDDLIEDLFVLDEVLRKETDTLIIVTEEPNDSLQAKLRYTYDHQGVFVVVHNIKRLQFNLLEHQLVPKVTLLDAAETQKLLETYRIKDLSQIPEMSRFDPLALAMGMRPRQVCRLRRISTTAYEYDYYRVCV